MGLRLPLDSLPEPEDEPLYERSPLEEQPPLGAAGQPVGAAAPEGEVAHGARYAPECHYRRGL